MKKHILNPGDIEWLKTKGIHPQQVNVQLERFNKGTIPAPLAKPAVIGDGIIHFTETEANDLLTFFERESGSRRVIKFVPASGAATRMFKELQNYLNSENGETTLTESERAFTREFIEGIKNKKFAFLEDLQEVLTRDGFHLENLIEKKNYRTVIEYLLQPKGLDYARLPKALLKFHRYELCGTSRTALEEHLVEGIAYSKDENNQVHIHFTISPELTDAFNQLLYKVLPLYKKEYNGVTFDIGFSYQKPSTDTVAVDDNNQLFRGENGSLVLRPGGHGAVIENLNDLDGEIIFIKNIDNLVPDHLKGNTIKYKKILGGHLLKIQGHVFECLRRLEAGVTNRLPGIDQLEEITAYGEKVLNISFPPHYGTWSSNQKQEFLFNKLNRPIRVCGMVKNEGEPGGGPFWIREKDGTLSLQIIEAAQVDHNSPEAQQILVDSTHFNPVDLVCAIKNYRGQKFDLTQFVDHEAYFISNKTQDGRPLKAMELPGLWNGAMAHWITIFVEVPLSTFNPVKTINDLLRTTHL